MKNLLASLLFLFSYFNCHSQEDNSSVPFVSYWGMGDSYDFQITKIKQKWKEGVLENNDSNSYRANFLVIDSTDVSYKIKWTYQTNLDKLNIPANLIEKFSKYKMTEVIYQTSEVGDFLGVENWKEISDLMNKILGELMNDLAANDDSKMKVLKSTFKPLLSAYSSREGIEQLILAELQLFHFPFGIEFSTKEPLIYEDQLPNMFGGKPIRGDAKIYIDSVDFDNAYCVLVQEMSLNPEDTKKMILNFFKKAKLNHREMKRAMKNALIDIRDYNTFAYLYYPGIPLKIESKRETILNIDKTKGKRVDITRIELIN